jgi:glycosyltransferase involved in cell wall biosynthesis
MIKVIQVITDTNIGGAGIWLLNFLKAYDRSVIDMAVVLPYDSMLKKKIEELNVRVIEAEGIADSSFSIKGVKSIDEIFKVEEPDIVHTHASLSARIAAKRNNIKVVHTRHCIEGEKKFLKKAVYRFVNNILSDRVIGVSKAVCSNLEADGINTEKLRMVYNGIFPLKEISASEQQALRKKYNIGSENVVVGMVARLEPVKNHEMFLEAAKVVDTICPEAVFMIVGAGSMEKKLRQKARRDGIEDKVIFTGYISDVNDIMNIIDIHVLTSEKEALSISLIEAMSLGKPVVATDSGGPGEVVENGKSGILVGVDDSVNLTMGIVRFIQRKDIRVEAGREGRRIVGEKFLAGDMARSIEEIYNELV